MMITPDRLQDAMLSVQRLVVGARFLAYRGERQEKVAELLDDVDHLIGLLLAPEDRSVQFEDVLRDVGSRFAAGKHALDAFLRQERAETDS